MNSFWSPYRPSWRQRGVSRIMAFNLTATSFHVYFSCAYSYVTVMCRSGVSLRGQHPPPALWGLVTELRSSSLVASAFIHWAISKVSPKSQFAIYDSCNFGL